jgi:hypothetical protein
METSTTLRERIHQLVDDQRIENDLLARVYEALSTSVEQTGGWEQMTPEQQEIVLKAYEESFDRDSLIPHETVKARYKKWLDS